MFAFSRDGAIPGSRYWSKVNAQRVPANAVIFVAVHRRDHHPAGAVKVDIDGAPCPVGVLRGRLGRGHRPLLLLRDPDLPAVAARRHVRGGHAGTTAQVQVDEPGRRRRDRHHLDLLILPTSPAGVPVATRSSPGACVNYAPILMLGVLLAPGDLVERLGEEVVHRPEARPSTRRSSRPSTTDVSAPRATPRRR